MARGDLNEATRARFGPLLPACGQRGGRWRDQRRSATASAGGYESAHRGATCPRGMALGRVPSGGMLRPVRPLATRRDVGSPTRPGAVRRPDAGELARTVCIDGPVVRAHQHAAGARRRCRAADRAASVAHAAGEALGPVLGAIRVPRPGGRGRPWKRPDHSIADKGYSYPTCRRPPRRRGSALPGAERRRAVCRLAVAMARRRDALRETGAQLSRGGRYCGAVAPDAAVTTALVWGRAR